MRGRIFPGIEPEDGWRAEVRRYKDFPQGLKSLCENCKTCTSAAEAALILLHLCRS
jgi:hypothetical protein